MKKENIKKWIIVGVVGILLVLAIAFLIINNKNNLTVLERKWIDDNTTSVLNINVPNNVNIFALDGSGVYYDFLDDFSTKYNLKLNHITYDYNIKQTDLSFAVSKDKSPKDIIFYEDHYVLLGINKEIINDYTDLFGKTIGVLSTDLSHVSKYINSTNTTFTQYANDEDLFSALSEDLRYIIVPKVLYIDKILKNDYEILFHLSDIKYYFKLVNNKETLSKVLTKYYNKYWEPSFNDSFKKNEFNTYTEHLKITEAEIETLRSGIINYGFLNSSPYDVLKNGIYGGINAILLKEFSDFADLDIHFIKYKTYKDLSKDINNKKVSLYFNKYTLNDTLHDTDFGYNLEYSIIVNKANPLVINSVNALEEKEVYIEKNSKLVEYFSKVKNIKIKTYETEKELFKLNKKDVIIVVDNNNFNFYNLNKLKNYTVRYTSYANQKLTFKINNKSTLYRLFNKYASLQDDKEIINLGVNNNIETTKRGKVLSVFAKYIIYLTIISGVVLYFVFRTRKKIKIAKKIKREDKIKYIDQLTSLKNRNYFNECLENWNNNIIYPQTIIVADLNNLKKINDQIGHTEGDKQISAFASALIKTQLDNSEIMRTDGNEFVIYLIGYNQKAITNYIRKLNKEVGKLPYKDGAKFGYSMIDNNLKTVEDALNDALIDMRKQKAKKTNEKKN